MNEWIGFKSLTSMQHYNHPDGFCSISNLFFFFPVLFRICNWGMYDVKLREEMPDVAKRNRGARGTGERVMISPKKTVRDALLH